ncbi:MAG: 2-oxo acid dehydrogenase subunit E2 [Bacteroidales bacterium]|nr:2-oxo acid dehydrogenase subunit E2 [Bacteroidales bacterium]
MASAEIRKKSIRDRRDRIFLKNLDSFHIIMPFVMPTRCANEAVLSEDFDITELDRYVKEKNASNPDFKYTWFHVICAALAKTIVLRPKMNYFISGYRMYERRDIEMSFVVKRKFEDTSEEALARFIVDKNGGSLVEQVHSFVSDFVSKVRVHNETIGITNQFNFFQYLPRPLFKLFVWFLRRLEYHGIYPKFLAKDDPCYCTVYITNLGSIKMSADYHHIFEWGTNSFFVVMSEMKYTPTFKEDGSYVVKPTIKLSFTIDERIADGFYFAKSIKLFRHLINNPELLDLDAQTPVDFQF